LATLRDIRRRIASVEKTREITRAMKTVAAVRVRNAQQALFAMRPYADRLAKMISSLCSHEERSSHPLLAEREHKNVLLAVLTSDKGLCGPFNTNILHQAEKYIHQLRKSGTEEVGIIAIGRKGRDYLKRRRHRITAEYSISGTVVQFDDARKIGDLLIGNFERANVDRVELIYNHYYSAGRQAVEVRTLLPIAELEQCLLPGVDYLYEPNKPAILNVLLPLYLDVQVWRILQESTASEYGARMTAMELASRNCEEVIDKVTLHYNKARQNSITKELIEVVSTAEAFK
jgi:F-type H+-transporting ATPase subunit gamma